MVVTNAPLQRLGTAGTVSLMDERLVLPAHAELATELVEWFEDVAAGDGSQFLWVPTDPEWGAEFAVADSARR